MKRLLSISLVLTLAMIILAGCGGKKETPTAASGSAVEYRDTLNVVFEAEPSTLFPNDTSEIWGATIMRLIYNTIIYRTNDDKQEFCSEIAKSWEYLNDTTIRFHLNDNIYWSNGEKLTADDVQFSMTIANANPKVHYYGQLEKVEIVDPLTVDVYTKGPNAALLSNFTQARSSIINKKRYEEVGMAAYGRNPLGTGPYVMESWKAGESIVLKARNDYWNGKGATPTIICRFVTESANRSVEMETGQADLITNPDFNDLDRLADLGFNVVSNVSYLISQVSINNKGVPDIKIRQALAYAIDYQSLVDAVYGKMATVADGLVPNLMTGYLKNWDVKYDPAKARQLISESRTPNGLTLEVMTTNLTENLQLAEILQYYWRQVGITVNVTQAAQAQIRERSDSGNYQVYPNFSNWATGDPSRALSGFSGARPETYNLPDNVTKELADIWNQALAEIDPVKRVEVYRLLQEKIKEQWVFFPLAHKKLAYVINKNVVDFYPSPTGSPELMMVRVKK